MEKIKRLAYAGLYAYFCMLAGLAISGVGFFIVFSSIMRSREPGHLAFAVFFAGVAIVFVSVLVTSLVRGLILMHGVSSLPDDPKLGAVRLFSEIIRASRKP